LASSSESFSYVLRPRLALQRPVLYLNDCPSEQSFFDCPVATACRSAQDAVMLGSGINAKDRGIGLGLVPSFERQPKRLPFQEAASNEGSRTRSAPAPITREQCRNASFGHSHGRRSRRPSPMLKPRGKKRPSKRVLALPDLEQSKAAVLNSLTSKSSQRTYDGAITNFVEWYCSEPRP